MSGKRTMKNKKINYPDEMNNQIQSSIKPMSHVGLNSKLPMPSAVKRVRMADEVGGIENIEPPPRKKVDFDEGSTAAESKRDQYVHSKEKMIAIVKPAVASSVKHEDGMKNRNLNKANKLKRRSIGILNKKPPPSVAPSASSRNIQMASNKSRSIPTVVPKIRNRVPPPTTTTSNRNLAIKPSIGRSSDTRNSGSSTNSQGATKPPAKKGRPGWDLKGRLTDLEESMMTRQNENMSLRNALDILQRQKVSLESEALQKTQISQETRHELDQVLHQLRQKTLELESKEELLRKLQRENRELQLDVDSCRLKIDELSASVSRLTASQLSVNLELESTKAALTGKVELYERISKNFRQVTDDKKLLEQKLYDQDHKLREAEMSRRKLHNMIQELKGNIRVFCRVRPYLPHEAKFMPDETTNPSHISFLDTERTTIEIIKDKATDLNDTTASSSIGSKRELRHSFSFDRVFDPSTIQKDVFEEISQLIQSTIDGYNVCIFAYGQTGSGKTYTMQGPEDEIFDGRESNHAGMIPLAVKQIFESAHELKSKGWEYKLEASYLEIYNEKIRDLLGEQSNEDQNLEIKFVNAPSNGQKTPPEIFVAGLNLVQVENDQEVHKLIALAVEKRAKAATKCNSRSSRSHAVFRLRIKGHNKHTGVNCDGTLTLVDLAGSERLKESESVGDRLKEAQNINKSLSTLGQVITSLSQKDGHVPYRNSKLTFLLQNYLGGNSKTLMFVNISPLEESINETINSLRFASKVNQCHIGTAFKK